MFVHSYISDLVILSQTTVFIKPNQVVSVSKPNQRPAVAPLFLIHLFIYPIYIYTNHYVDI